MIPNTIYQGDSLAVLKTFPDESIDCCVTSPPYWALRDYGCDKQLGLETTFQEYIQKLCDIFDEVKRVLKPQGTCWVNLGDTYGGSNGVGYKETIENSNRKIGCGENISLKLKLGIQSGTQKCLLQIPSRFAIEMVDRGWILRNEVIWHKPSCMPASVKDRFTVDFEKIFFFVKNKKYYFEQQFEPIKKESQERLKRGRSSTNKRNIEDKRICQTLNKSIEADKNRIVPDKRNKRTVWSVNLQGTKEKHFAVYPPKLIIPMIRSGCPENGIVLDIFFGSGTTGFVAKKLNRQFVGIELNPEYIKIAEKRIFTNQESML